MGVFVNFKDFKGNTLDAVNKLIGDLKKFGSQSIRSCKPEHLEAGFGEEICHLVDELLNIELYRRDYQFSNPQFPEDVESDEQEDAAGTEQDFTGTQELNGIQIKTKGDSISLIGGSEVDTQATSQRTAQKSVFSTQPAEETKINFFDPHQYEAQEALFEKAEEDQIIEAKTDPVEWHREVENLEGALRAVSKDIELAKERGRGALGDEIEEHRRHVDLIIDLCQDLRRSSHVDTRKVIAKIAEGLTDSLNTIRRHERRINDQHQNQILNLNHITKQKKGLAQELRGVIDRVKKLDFDSKQVCNELVQVNHEIEEKMKDIHGGSKLKNLKIAIWNL